MGDYSDGQNVLLHRPEPGRPARKIVKETKKEEINVDSIADAVIKAIVNKMPVMANGQVQAQHSTADDFDSSASLSKLAEAMTVSKESEGKIDGIGIIKETKKDEKETKKTIDLLSQLGD